MHPASSLAVLQGKAVGSMMIRGSFASCMEPAEEPRCNIEASVATARMPLSCGEAPEVGPQPGAQQLRLGAQHARQVRHRTRDLLHQGRVGAAHAHNLPQRAQVHQRIVVGGGAPQPHRHVVPCVRRCHLVGHLRAMRRRFSVCIA